jgi:hypothetical protein
MKWDIPDFHSLVQGVQCLRWITSRCMNPSNFALRLPRLLKGGTVCICYILYTSSWVGRG